MDVEVVEAKFFFFLLATFLPTINKPPAIMQALL